MHVKALLPVQKLSRTQPKKMFVPHSSVRDKSKSYGGEGSENERGIKVIKLVHKKTHANHA